MKRIIKIGMDVHTTNYTLCVFEPSLENKSIVHQISDVKPDVKFIVDVIDKFKKKHSNDELDITCGYEAGCLGYSLYHELEENIKLAYRLLSVKGYGPAQTNRLLWKVCAQVSSMSNVESLIANALSATERETFSNDYDLYYSLSNSVSYLSILDERYPTELKNSLAQNAPTVLSYIGNLDLLKKNKVAFSGSRKVLRPVLFFLHLPFYFSMYCSI